VAGSSAGVLLIVVALLLPPHLRQRKARDDVRVLDLALNGYVYENAQAPEGTPAEMAALLQGKSIRGQNTKHLDYVEADLSEVNDRGEFIDPWGTPYRMSVTNRQARVYSCGPNRKDENGSGDDIVPR
jgi:type II secretory pathway pseudopilin PulG